MDEMKEAAMWRRGQNIPGGETSIKAADKSKRRSSSSSKQASGAEA